MVEATMKRTRDFTASELAGYVFAIAASKGFHDNDKQPGRFAEYCANLHGEVSELWEAYRRGELEKPCDKNVKIVALGLEPLTCAEEELADIIIRAMDTACGLGIDIGRAIEIKCAYNSTRPRMHGKVC
jgi:NTP pyrophosphatase (non-canonical NTP hydrolase)